VVKAGLRPLVHTLAVAGWRWAAPIEKLIGTIELKNAPLAGFKVWRKLAEWEDEAPPGKPSSLPVSLEESRARLMRLVGDAGEARPEQRAYADAASYAFTSRERAGAPRIALVEAGTGIGKTLAIWRPPACGGEERPRPLDFHLHPQSAAPDRAGESPGSIPIPPSATRRRSCARAARIISAC